MRRFIFLSCPVAVVSAAAHAQVEIPPGFEIVDAVTTDNHIHWPSLNDCGEIAYVERLGGGVSTQEVLLYDNGSIAQITTNSDRDASVYINNDGEMVWVRGLGSRDAHQVILYQQGVELVLQDDPERGLGSASISNPGLVAWSRIRLDACPLRSEAFLYDGVSIRSIYSSDLMMQSFDINDAGWITWMSSDFCVGPWVGTIQLYCDGSVVDLPSSESQVQGPRINNRAQIVWDALSNLELWEDGESRLLLDTGDAGVPNIGDTGDVYFARFDRSRRLWNAWLYRLEKNGPCFYRLTDETYSASRGSVNAWGEVAWVEYRDPEHGDPGSRIGLMRRIRTGDSEFDGEVDQADYARLHGCLTGPIKTTGLCECRFLDQDHDGDLDLADFARFQSAFGSM